MAKKTIGAGISLDGEKEFRAAVSGIDKDIKILASEMKKVTSEFADNADSMEAVTAKQKVLNKQIDEQTGKINTLKNALENAKKEYGENSDKVKDWQIKLNNAETELNKTQNELKKTNTSLDSFGKGADEGGKEVKILGEHMDKTSKKTLSFGDVLNANLISSAIVGGVKALGSAIASVGSKMAEMATAAIETADEMLKMSSETGFSTDKLQELQYIGDDVGVSLDLMTTSMSKLINNMSSASEGTGTAYEAFNKLGISVTDANGNLRDSNTVYSEALAALGSMTNETERTAIAQDLFGRSAAELNPLIELGADGMADLAEQARKTGAIMSGDALQALDDFGDAVDHMKQSMKAAVGTMLSNFMPAVTKITDGFSELINGSITVEDFTKLLTDGMNEIITQINTFMPTLLEQGAVIIVSILNGMIQMLPSIITSGTTILTSLIDSISANLPMIIDSAITIVMALVMGLVQNLPKIIEGALTLFNALCDALLDPDTLKLIITAGMQAVISLVKGLTEALPELIPAVMEAILTIVDTLLLPENIDSLIDAGIDLIFALIDGLIDATSVFIDRAPEIIQALFDALIENGPKILDAGWELIKKLAKGIVDNISEIKDTVDDIIKGMSDKFAEKIDDIKEIGIDIVKGVWKGIKDKIEWFKEKVGGFFDGIIGGINKLLDSHSPSRVFAGIGTNMALGLGEGFTSSMKDVTKDINKSIPTNIEMQGSYNVRGKMLESAVNGISTALSSQNLNISSAPIILDGREIARVMFQPLQDEGLRLGAN